MNQKTTVLIKGWVRVKLRDAIWTEVFRKGSYCYAPLAYDLLRTNKQIRHELAPYLYQTVVFHLHRPWQALHWIHTIGTLNRCCIRRLVLKFSSIEAKPPGDNASDIWSASLGSLPSLETLTYEYDPANIYKQDPTNCIEHHPGLCSHFARTLSLNPKIRNGSSKHDEEDGVLSSYSNHKDRPITHAVLAIDDTIPEILVLPFRSLLEINSNIPLEQNITGLPPGFLLEHNLHPSRTYLFIEDPQRPSVTLTYRKTYPLCSVWKAKQPSPNIPAMISVLPRLLYLRLGCPTTNSNFLAHLPPTLQTLDVAFTDANPERVAANLDILHQRCEQLFTFAIAVSPLHDNNDLPEGGRQIKEGTPESKEQDTKKEWMPFWKALRDIQATGVRVWEGEGPGFKRANRHLQVDDN
ncbi:MAG: hypothetical protein Q9166_003947 [cf. Caloplaca sp. 2 TL-2023]